MVFSLLVAGCLALPITDNEVKLRQIAISKAKPELLRTAVKYARPELLRVALTDAKPAHLEAALTASEPALLRTALTAAREDTLRTALTQADISLLAVAVTKVGDFIPSHYIIQGKGHILRDQGMKCHCKIKDFRKWRNITWTVLSWLCRHLVSWSGAVSHIT